MRSKQLYIFGQLLSCVWLFVTPWIAVWQELFFARELAHIHVYWIGDAICSICLILCHPFLLLPSVFLNIRILKMSWLFALSSQSIEASASVLPMTIFGWFPLELTGLISFLSRGLVFFSTIIQRRHFFGSQLCLWSNSHIRALLLEKP